MRLENRALVNYIKFYFKKNQDEPGVVAQTCNPSTSQAEAYKLLQIHTRRAWIHEEFQASLGYNVKACLKTNNSIKKQKARVKIKLS